MSRRQTPIGQWLVAGIVLLAAIAAGVFIWRKALHPDEAPPAPVAAASVPAPAAAASAAAAPPSPQYPIAADEPAPADSSPLPLLEDSDNRVGESLAGLSGADGLRDLLLPLQLVRHMVATVDALPRQGIAVSILPLRTPTGAFVADAGAQGSVLSERNAARYAPYMRIVDAIDVHALAGWYRHYYPLFQQAYRDLGYPQGYFNDRVIAAIDNMLAAPSPTGPVTLIRGDHGYLFADPNLQALSAGQKLMIRLGPENEAKAKARLREVRVLLVRRNIGASRH